MKVCDDLKRKLEYLKETKAKLKEKVGGLDTDAFRELAEKVVQAKEKRVDFEDLEDGGQRATIIGLPNGAFADTTEVVIEEGATAIRSSEFMECDKIKKITIPESVQSLGSTSTFRNCTSLEEIDIPEGITTIPRYSFQQCTALKSIKIPESTTEIGDYAFNSSGLTEITIPENVKTVGRYAFYQCYGLTKIDIKGGESIGDNCFYMNADVRLTSLSLGSKIKSIGKTAFFYIGCGLDHLVLPESLESLGLNVFYGLGYTANSFADLIIPKNVKTIGENCFQCLGAKTVIFKGTPTSIASTCFSDSKVTAIKVPWSEGAVSGAPWGATNATITYDYTEG